MRGAQVVNRRDLSVMQGSAQIFARPSVPRWSHRQAWRCDPATAPPA